MVGDDLVLGEELGAGAVATVHRARDAAGAAVAVKLLHERNARDPTARRRFAREAELARSLRAANIVAVHGAVEIDGRTALVMELVEGPTLADVIARDAPLPEARLLALGRGIAAGLAVAHDGGVIHRDLKPANVLVATESGEIPKIADFGMARAASFAGIDRESMTVLGTPSYMAPESLDPLAIDPRSDLYALGCMLYEMACGEPPFSAPTPFAVLQAHRERPPDLDRVRAHLSPGSSELVAALLAKQPSDRPHAASAVVERIDALLAGDSATGGEPRPGSTALAVPRPAHALAAAEAGRCARCGAPVIDGVRVCLDCGLIRVQIRRGPFSVFVVGPGAVGDKLDTISRDRLLTWVRANPDSGLDPEPLAERIPRLPFTVITRISKASADALAQSLNQLGIRAELRKGGRLAHGQMLEKIVRMGGRRSQAALPLVILGLPLIAVLIVMALPLLPIYLGAVGWFASRPALGTARTRARLKPPPRVEAQLRELERQAPHLGPRHRPALRAIVRRVVALIEHTRDEPAIQAELDPEMAHALAVAVVGTRRLDELDSVVSRPDFDPGDPDQRRDLQERDLWSARLLELTATLDALAIREASAKHALRAAEIDETSELDQLRARVEALEEVSRM